jgi:DNA-nicking Smr family endonuclease
MRDVVPLRGRPPHPPMLATHPPPPSAEAPLPAAAPPRRQPAKPASLPPLDRFAGIDRASAERLKRGRYLIEARLDLHGMTQDEAYCALHRFVPGSRSRGRRCVLVITGHGRTTGGILKTMVPRWLDEPRLRQDLLAVTPAQPRDGGTAALYLLLRRASGLRPRSD